MSNYLALSLLLNDGVCGLAAQWTDPFIPLIQWLVIRLGSEHPRITHTMYAYTTVVLFGYVLYFSQILLLYLITWVGVPNSARKRPMGSDRLLFNTFQLNMISTVSRDGWKTACMLEPCAVSYSGFCPVVHCPFGSGTEIDGYQVKSYGNDCSLFMMDVRGFSNKPGSIHSRYFSWPWV